MRAAAGAPPEGGAPVAQLDRAPDYKSGGREFEISPGAPRSAKALDYVLSAQQIATNVSK